MTRQGQSSLTHLKNGSEIFNFLMRHKIYDMEDLEKKVNAMHRDVNSVRDNLKKVERRIDTLQEHLRHSDNFKKYRKRKKQYEDLYSQYQTIKKSKGFGWERKAQKALDAANEYHETYRSEIAMFEKADEYLRGVLQDRFDPKKLPPITKWQNELAAKATEKEALYQEYYTLKDETHKVEKIRASVKVILHNDTPKRTVEKSWEVGL